MSKKSILLVDDEEPILKTIGWELENNGFTVVTALNGQEAIDKLNSQQFELVITDLRMAPIDGIGVLKHAKMRFAEIGVIILTGYGEIGTAVEAIQMGADDYLQKPCDIEVLLKKAGNSFEKQDLLAKLRKQNAQLQEEITARKTVERKLQKSRANLNQMVEKRTAELAAIVEEMKIVVTTLQVKEREIEKKNCELQDINTTLNILLKRREQEQSDLKKELITNTQELVIPLLAKAETKVKGSTRDYINTAKIQLQEIFSEQSSHAPLMQARLSPRELQVVNMIKQDKTSKEIADLLGLSVRTVTTYRDNIRKKLRIKNQKKNLKKLLTSLQ